MTNGRLKAGPSTAPRQAGIWAVLTLLLLASLQGAGQTPSLRVISATPVGELGEIGDADQVRIMFSEAMVPLGMVPAGTPPPWIRMSPAAAGSFYWSGTKTLIFSPDAAAPLPHATQFTVRIDGSAASLSGRTLGTPHEFTFTTPTVRLLEAGWYRKTSRFDSPAVILLRFNQRVVPEAVAAQVHVTLTPHTWTAPPLTDRARQRWQETDPAGLRSFDDKVEAVRRVTSRLDWVDARIAASWDERRFPPEPELVVLETIGVPAPDSWLTVFLKPGLASPEGPLTAPAQSTVLKLEPSFFATGPRCTEACDPSAYNPLGFMTPVSLAAVARALEVVDVSSPSDERRIVPVRAIVDALEESTRSPTLHTLGFDAQPPSRTWRLRLDAALTASDGQTLGYPWVGFVENGHAPPLITFEGAVWESGAGPQLPLIARNVSSDTRSIEPVTPSSLVPRLLAHERERRSSTRTRAGGESLRLDSTPDVVQAHGVDLRPLLSPKGTGLVWASVAASEVLPGYVRRPPLGHDRWPPSDSTDVQITNLGISVKDSPQVTLVFVTRLDTGVPVPGASLAIVDTNNQTRWRGATGQDGVALAPPLAVPRRSGREGFSFVVTAEKDGDFAYVGSEWVGDARPSEWGLSYDLSESAAVLRGSVFTDRGVYKQTEEVHFKAVLRDDTPNGMRLLPKGSAVDVVVYDGRDREVDRRTIEVNRWSSADWIWQVPGDAGLGYYRIQLSRAGEEPSYVSGVKGHFLVAAFRRPDFRVDASLAAEPPVLGSTLRGTVEAKYLFGGALGARPVHWWSAREAVQGATEAIRDRYPESRYAVGYLPRDEHAPNRVDPRPDRYGALDADGRTTIALATAAEGDAAYSYRLEASVEDVSGQQIANRATVVMHPASVYVAVSRPPMFVHARTGTRVGVNVVNLAGESIAGIPVTVSLLREHWVSGRLPDRPGFQWERREIPAGEWTVQSAAGESTVQIPVREGGCYTLRAIARDAAGRQTRTELTFYAMGPGLSSWRAEGNRINLTPERETWKPGEKARILIQSPWERATALLTVEREGIRSHRTFTVTSTQDTVDVPITEADIPNVYVSVMLVKGRTSEAGDDDPGRPSYRVGYTQLSVDDGSKRLQVDVSVDREEYRPRQPVAVSVAVANRDGKPASGAVTLWAVDYGLLSLTNYSTPDVLKAIFVPKALQVMTLDNRQRLMRRRPLAPPPDFPIGVAGSVIGGVVGGLAELVTVSSAVGSGFLEGQGGNVPEFRKDFRPLVFWLGSATTDAGGRAKTTVTLPDSLTTYRVMAVAGDDSSRFGFGEREFRVTKPLTLLPAFPRFLTKGDRASFGAVVTNSGKAAGDAVVTIQSLDSKVVQFGAAAKTTVSLAAGQSERVRFDAVARESGTARVRMLVTLGGETDAFEMPLLVSESVSSEVTAAYGDTVGTATEALALEPGALPGAGGLTVDLASTALVGVGESARYLDRYPYECAEQRTSRALALLLAADLGGAFSLSGSQPDAYKAQALRALNGLYGYQCWNGGFALWPGRCGGESAYLTAYVLHVLKVAGRLKYDVDSEAVDRALGYLEQQLKEKPPEIRWWPAWAASQAYALKVLAEFGRTRTADIRRLAAMSERLPMFALSYVADALAASNDRGPQYEDILRRLTNGIRVGADRAHVEEIDEDALGWLWNTNVSATAVVLEGLSRRGDAPTFAAPLVRWLLAARTNGRWGTTHENAKGLEALVNYYRAFESDVPRMTATVKIGSATVDNVAFNGRSTKAEQIHISMADLVKQGAVASSPTLSIAKRGTGRVYYTARVERFVPASANAVDRGFHVERRYERYIKDGSSPAGTSFDAGDLIRVTVAVTLRGEGRYLALTDPLPAGVEPIDGWLQTTARDFAEDATRERDGDRASWWRRSTFDHVEKHDDRVVAFATRLGSGRHEFSHVVRATMAGTFHAAGARLEAMYAPELGGGSEAATVTIRSADFR